MSVFSIDLVPAAKQHLWFLTKAHREGVTMNPVKESTLHRYLNVWLPLVAANPQASFVPPIDIAWLWHCHRLAPLRYESFCLRRFNVILEPSPAFVFQTETNVDEETVCVWTERHPGEPLFPLDDMDGNKIDAVDPEVLQDLLDGFNILESARAQADFLWQVSGAEFQENSFLEQAVQNYHKFLLLSHGDLPLVPTYQIDFIWHTHMLASTSGYNRDCLAIRGGKFHHDDSLNDRTKGAKLEVSFRDTCRRWYDAYGESYEVVGGMYRGEPEVDYYNYATWNPSPAIPTAVASLIGTAGAVSSGENSVWVEPRAGKGSFALKKKNKDSFIKMNLRTSYVNANPKVDGYVFGRGSLGDGYYSLQTKDAYRIMKLRLSKQYGRVHELYQQCDATVDCCCGPSAATIEAKERYKERMDPIRELLAVVNARLTMAGPDSRITLEGAKRFGAKGTHRRLASKSPGFYDGTPAMLAAGAGCGGDRFNNWGGNGGAACGAFPTDDRIDYT